MKPLPWVYVDEEYDHTPLRDTVLDFKGPYMLKKTQHTVSTMQYLNRRTPVLIEFRLLNHFVKKGYDLVPARDNKSEYNPAKLVGQLERYSVSPDVSAADAEALAQARAITFRAFGGNGSLHPVPLGRNLSSVTKMEKSSGLPELKKKGEAFDNDLGRAFRILSGKMAPPPCVAYHRIQHGVKGPKTRLVWGYPQSMFLLEAKFAPKLIHGFLKSPTPMVFGLNKTAVNARLQRIRNSGVRYSLDFSGFDSSIAADFITFAFDVLRTHFSFESREDEVAWSRIVHYFIHTPIMMPDTNVWVKHHGVPSGSYFTQMVDSIVNYMAVTYAWLRVKGTAVQEDRLLVLGDDSIVGQSELVSVDELALRLRELGLNLSVEKTQVSFASRRDDPHFLGHYWGGGFAYRPLRELVIRMCFPEKPSGIHDSTERAVIRALSYVSDAINAGSLVREIAPIQSAWLEQEFASFDSRIDPDREIESSMRTGLQSHMQDEGLLEAATPFSLVTTMPVLGPWM